MPTVRSAETRGCRFCGSPLRQTVIDLGMSPLCQTHIEPSQLNQMERFYPLHVYVCENCFLVQLEEYVRPEEIFSEYAYFSSYVGALLKQAKEYADAMEKRFDLGARSKVVEIASNDGYLLQYFLEKGIPVLGVEPAANVAQVAIGKGIPTMIKFFGQQVAQQIARDAGKADLLLGNNVLSQIPDLNDFVAGMKILLKPHGVLTMDFQHLIRMIDGNEFDTIYHEHFSYFSFTTVKKVFEAHGLALFDVEELRTHGGSLRIFGRHSEDSSKPISQRVADFEKWEESWGVRRVERYSRFAERVGTTKREILKFLIKAREEGKAIAGYGAPGKGNTLLNYCGIRTDFIDYTVDRNPYKQGKYTPGTRIPIYHPDKITETKPDYLFILPWNLKDEIIEQNAFIRDWGGQFVVPIPEVKVYR